MDRVIEIDPTYAKAYLVLGVRPRQAWPDPQYQPYLDQAVALGIDRTKVELNIAATSPSLKRIIGLQIRCANSRLLPGHTR